MKRHKPGSSAVVLGKRLKRPSHTKASKGDHHQRRLGGVLLLKDQSSPSRELTMTIEELTFYVAMAGTVAFASSAVLCVAERKVDLFAAVVLGIITAVGGGTVRDVILDVPIFWASDLSYIWVGLAASIATFFAYNLFGRRAVPVLFLYVDGLAVALFAIQATGKVWGLKFGLPVAPAIMGVITAIGGGLIRDVLAGRQTLLMSRELYAVPVLIGCILFTLVLAYAPEYRFSGSIVCLSLIFGLRGAAIRWNLQVPEWATMGFRATIDSEKRSAEN